MNTKDFVDLIFQGGTSVYGGKINHEGIRADFVVQSEMKQTQAQDGLVIVVNISLNKTNVGSAITYIIEIATDKADKVLSDLETIMTYMFYGVDKVAKKIVPRENKE